MFRFIIAAVIIYTIYRLWKKAGRNRAAENKAQIGPGEMTACSSCGTFVLISEAIVRSGAYYCSTKCIKH
jgi:hypothetical protein